MLQRIYSGVAMMINGLAVVSGHPCIMLGGKGGQYANRKQSIPVTKSGKSVPSRPTPRVGIKIWQRAERMASHSHFQEVLGYCDIGQCARREGNREKARVNSGEPNTNGVITVKICTLPKK
jgi:hypothetical protein